MKDHPVGTFLVSHGFQDDAIEPAISYPARLALSASGLGEHLTPLILELRSGVYQFACPFERDSSRCEVWWYGFICMVIYHDKKKNKKRVNNGYLYTFQHSRS